LKRAGRAFHSEAKPRFTYEVDSEGWWREAVGKQQERPYGFQTTNVLHPDHTLNPYNSTCMTYTPSHVWGLSSPTAQTPRFPYGEEETDKKNMVYIKVKK
jgi:hypothetical protein